MTPARATPMQSRNPLPKVMVTGVGGAAGFALIKILRKQGVRVVALDCDPALAENPIHAGHAARSYSCRAPPRRSRLRMSRCVIWPGSVSGVGSGWSGRALAMPWWGRCSL
jgi:UDP-N-acetylmuramoylalanine-D-glutamate ligase